MTTQTCRSKGLSPKPSSRRKTPQETSRTELAIEELKQQQGRLLEVVKQNEKQRLRLLKDGDYLAAQQLFNANMTIGRELIPINKEIADRERATLG